MSAQLETCGCRAETAKTTSPGGAKDASETAVTRGGVAEYVFRSDVCGSGITFRSYEEKYRYLRGKSATSVPCTGQAITFPCCTATTLACASCEEEEEEGAPS